MSSKSVKLINSDVSDLKILFIHENEEKCNIFEAKTEVDDDLLRMRIYCKSSIDEAQNIVRSFSPDIVFVPSILGKVESADILSELKSIHSGIQIVLYTDRIEIQSMHHIVTLGGLMNIIETKNIESYQGFKSEVVSAARRYNTLINNNSSRTERVVALGNAIQIKDQTEENLKIFANSICPILLKNADYNASEKQAIVLASMLYSPSVHVHKYEKILGAEDFDILSVLLETGSVGAPPTGAKGFIVKFSHAAAQILTNGGGANELLQLTAKRPNELKHSMIRAIDQKIVDEIVNSVSLNSQYKNASGE